MSKTLCRTRLRLPVQRGRGYRLTTDVAQQLLQQIGDNCKITSVMWEDGDCIADVEFILKDKLESQICSMELKLNGDKTSRI